MPDISTIAAAFSSFKSLKDIAQAMVSLRDADALAGKIREFNGALIDAQQTIFAVQEERATLVETVRTLEAKVAQIEAWEAEKQRYELVALAPNLVAYALKEAMRGTEPPHYLCAGCYAAGKKSFLQQETRGQYLDAYRCHGCGERITISKGMRPQLGSRGGGGPNSWMGA